MPPPAPKWTGPRSRRGWNLPVATSTFIGRQQERNDLARVLIRGDSRVIILVGPPGIGKTRLAFEVSSDLAPRFQYNVGFVQPSDGESDGGTEWSARRLGLQIGASPALLVVDRVSHVAWEENGLARLLTVCPRLSVIATSQTSGVVDGGVDYVVEPLDIPAPGSTTVERLAATESVALFVDRARLARSGFRLTTENAVQVALVVRDLDGIPAAIELVAGGLARKGGKAGGSDSADFIVNAWHTDGGTGSLVRRSIEWSYQELPTNQRKVFARLSVFERGWSVAAARLICDDDKVDTTIHELARRNLVKPLADGGYRILITMRTFARERLAEDGDRQAVRKRHAQYFTELAEAADESIRNQTTSEALEVIEEHHADMRAALRWCFDNGCDELGARLSAALEMFWYLRGWVHEATYWFDLAVERVIDPKELRAAALYGASRMALRLSQFDRGRALLEERLKIARQLRSKSLEIETRLLLVSASSWNGNLSLADEDIATLEPLIAKYGNKRHRASYLVRLGNIDRMRGKLTQALADIREGGQIAEEDGDYEQACSAYLLLALTMIEQEDFVRATLELRQVLRICVRHHQTRLAPYCLEGLALTATRGNGLNERAAILMGASENLRETLGCPREKPLDPLIRNLMDESSEFRHAREHGAHLSLEEVIDIALEGRTGMEKGRTGLGTGRSAS